MNILFYLLIIINYINFVMNYTRFINYNEIITKAKLCRVCYSKSNTFNI